MHTSSGQISTPTSSSRLTEVQEEFKVFLLQTKLEIRKHLFLCISANRGSIGMDSYTGDTGYTDFSLVSGAGSKRKTHPILPLSQILSVFSNNMGSIHEKENNPNTALVTCKGNACVPNSIRQQYEKDGIGSNNVTIDPRAKFSFKSFKSNSLHCNL